MSHKSLQIAFSTLLALSCISSTGCLGIQFGPNLGIFGYPTPVSPYFQDKEETQFWNHERYARIPIMGPLTAGGPVQALDVPSDDEVMQALERARPVSGGLPFIYEKNRNNVKIVKHKIADYVDPPRFIPLIGPAQLHHAHYKCTVYYTEITNVGWPLPHRLVDEEAVEVIYIDHNHFHMVGNVDTGAGSNY